MRVIYRARNEKGEVSVAEVESNGKRYRWSPRGGVMQWIVMPVCGPHGYGEGYWRKAGKNDANAVMEALRHNNQPSGH
jgi:hypothetical protein